MKTIEDVRRVLETHTPHVGLLLFSPRGDLHHADSGGRALRARLQDESQLVAEVRRVALVRDPAESRHALRLEGGGWVGVNLSRLPASQDVAVTLSVLPAAKTAPPEPRPLRSPLTPREREVARLAVKGLANSEIARELDASPNTIKQHLANAYRKTGVAGRNELAAFVGDNHHPEAP